MTPVNKNKLEFAIPLESGWLAENFIYSYGLTINYELYLIDSSGQLKQIAADDTIWLYHDIKNSTGNAPRLVLRTIPNLPDGLPEKLIWESLPAKNSPFYYPVDSHYFDYHFYNSRRSDKFVGFCGNEFSKDIKPCPRCSTDKKFNNEFLFVDLYGGRSVLMETPVPCKRISISSDELTVLVYGDDGFVVVDNPFV